MMLKPLTMILLPLALVLGVAACGGSDDVPGAVPEAPQEASIQEIHTLFQQDLTDFNNQWRDKVIIVKGSVRRTGDSEGRPLVSVQHAEGGAADCYMAPDNGGELDGISQGQVITLQATVFWANRESLELADCRVMSVQ